MSLIIVIWWKMNMSKSWSASLPGKNGFWKSIKSTTMNVELNSRMDWWVNTAPAVINVCSASSTRCLRACVRLCILRMMTPVFHFCREIISPWQIWSRQILTASSICSSHRSISLYRQPIQSSAVRCCITGLQEKSWNFSRICMKHILRWTDRSYYVKA